MNPYCQRGVILRSISVDNYTRRIRNKQTHTYIQNSLIKLFWDCYEAMHHVSQVMSVINYVTFKIHVPVFLKREKESEHRFRCKLLISFLICR